MSIRAPGRKMVIHMNNLGKAFCAAVLLSMLIALPISVSAGGTARAASQTQSVVLLEEFTATNCPNCPFVAGIMDKLWKYHGSDKVAIIAYHVGDEIEPAGVASRFNYYGVTGTPTTEMDGINEVVGSDAGYGVYNSTVNARLSVPRNFTISCSGDVSSGSVTVHLESAAAGPAGLKLRYAVIESKVEASGGKYNFVARALPAQDAVTLPLPSGGADFTKTFSVGGTWNAANMAFVAYLQGDGNKEVLQSCFYGGQTAPEPILPVLISAGGLFAAVWVIAARKREDISD